MIPILRTITLVSDLTGLHSEILYPRGKKKKKKKERRNQGRGTMDFKAKLVPNTKVLIHLKGEKGF